MVRQIVYLDHSVLSNLAKNPSTGLLENLTDLVEADKALFPFSWIHHYESELDSRVEEEIHRVGMNLSRGIHLQPTSQIVSGQANRAYLSFVGRSDPRPLWSDAYLYDPHGDIGGPIPSGRVISAEEDRNRRRSLKEQFAASLSNTRSQRDPTADYENVQGSFAEEAVQIYFKRPWRKALRGAPLTFGDHGMLAYGTRASDTAFGIGLTPSESFAGFIAFFQFLDSDYCSGIPFIALESSILASLEVDERDRNYDEGDFL